jgi:two-component system cell cycle sensor histidine kinase/response regulator CckA
VSDFLQQLADSVRNPESPCRAVLNALPEGIFLIGTDRNIIFANEVAIQALQSAGLSLEEPTMAFGSLFQFLDPESERVLPDDETPLSRALSGEVAPEREYMIRRINFSARHWVAISAHPLREGSTVIAALYSFRRIGDKKKREIALEAAGALNDIIYQENLAGIIRVTVDGRILDCNDAIVDMLGFPSKKRLLSFRVEQLYYEPTDRERILRRLNSARRVNKFEVCFRRNDGGRCWVLLNARLLNPPPGEVGGTIVSSVVDITERKLQEEAIRQSEERFTAFMQYLPGVAFIRDLTGRYLYHNEASSRLFGIDPVDMIGKTSEEVWPPEHATLYRDSDALVIRTARPAEYLAPVRHLDGIHSWLFHKFPISVNGAVAMVGGIGIDVTERSILEDQLAQARKMEALGRLAGGIAHDFNNLLTVMAGYSQLAVESIGNVPTDRVMSYLLEILDSSRKASDLTGQLLAFSRRQTVQPKALNLAELVRGMERLLQRVLGEHIQLIVRCPHKDSFVQADANQMEQAIMNLATNSRDAMPLGGQLQISCERLATALLQENGPPLNVLLEVRDTGIGMEDEERSHIFDPFYTSKEPGKGTGLGLSTVYGVVKQANGRIDVESTPGEGTVFRLWFPETAESLPEGVTKEKSGGPAKGKETVLLVEDEAAVRDLVETILTRVGYRVLAADSGPAALLVWENAGGTVDVVLTDVIMPQMSGGELADRLRALNPRLRVLFMSGYTDDMISSHGVLTGEIQLIQKPFTAESLGKKLRAVLDA